MSVSLVKNDNDAKLGETLSSVRTVMCQQHGQMVATTYIASVEQSGRGRTEKAAMILRSATAKKAAVTAAMARMKRQYSPARQLNSWR
mmetsp:Transcript_29945/g.79825  ORF Transcript_29945/g.79825 Transcript_29945/m.79825 type:complete len:88 (-) Transcript_29945:3017-3280(-)